MRWGWNLLLDGEKQTGGQKCWFNGHLQGKWRTWRLCICKYFCQNIFLLLPFSRAKKISEIEEKFVECSLIAFFHCNGTLISCLTSTTCGPSQAGFWCLILSIANPAWEGYLAQVSLPFWSLPINQALYFDPQYCRPTAWQAGSSSYCCCCCCCCLCFCCCWGV